MRCLLLNQAYYPDVATSAQHLTDLGRALAARGHQVHVLASRRSYTEPGRRFASRSQDAGVTIRRVWNADLGKGALWRRTIDSLSFFAAIVVALASESKPDLLVVVTWPPLLGTVAALYCRLRGVRLAHWVMDLNPDEAIALGYLRAESKVARVLHRLSTWSLRRSDLLIVMDSAMRDRLAQRGLDPARITVVPPWPHESEVSEVAREHNSFLARHGLAGKFVVMYAGNHSPCHSLTTLLNAALLLRQETDIVFCFVGGGLEKEKVRAYRDRRGLTTILELPFVPATEVASMLSAADLHVVVMGDAFLGIVHPCKIYGVLAVNRPFLFIGPAASHVGEIAADPRALGVQRDHGDAAGVAAEILGARGQGRRRSQGAALIHQRFSQSALTRNLIRDLEIRSQRGARAQAAGAQSEWSSRELN